MSPSLNPCLAWILSTQGRARAQPSQHLRVTSCKSCVEEPGNLSTWLKEHVHHCNTGQRQAELARELKASETKSHHSLAGDAENSASVHRCRIMSQRQSLGWSRKE